MPDERSIQAERDGHMLVATMAHTFIRTMVNLGTGYELNDGSDELWECSPMALLIHVRDQALLALVGTPARVSEIVTALDGVTTEPAGDFSDSGHAARRAVLAVMRKGLEAEEARLSGYRLGAEFARFEALYGGTVLVLAVPELYRAHSGEFEREFQRARAEYDPSTARRGC